MGARKGGGKEKALAPPGKNDLYRGLLPPFSLWGPLLPYGGLLATFFSLWGRGLFLNVAMWGL